MIRTQADITPVIQSLAALSAVQVLRNVSLLFVIDFMKICDYDNDDDHHHNRKRSIEVAVAM